MFLTQNQRLVRIGRLTFKMKVALCFIVTILSASILCAPEKDEHTRQSRSVRYRWGKEEYKKYSLGPFQVNLFLIKTSTLLTFSF